MENLSIFLIEKEPNTMQLLKMYLKELDYVEIIGESEDLNNSIAQVLKILPDVIITDISENPDKNYEIIESIIDYISYIIN